MRARALVVAKAPVAGRVKTRLAATVGADAAARLAAASLADTILACREAFDECHLALEGDLAEAVDGDLLTALLSGWHVMAQCEGDLGRRLAHAHGAVGARFGGPVVQVGMDTPHLDPVALRAIAEACRPGGAVLGPAEDGGWWVLALHGGTGAAALASVPTSTPTTGADTRRALEDDGLVVEPAALLRDVDTAADARAVAAIAPATRFARLWRGIEVAA